MLYPSSRSSFDAYAISFKLLYLITQLTVVSSEIRPFHGYLEAASFFVHFTSSYVNVPGIVDLSNLKFTLPIPPTLGVESATVDIVVFREPDSCAHSKMGCDWTEQGIGYKDEFGDVLWCCTASALGDGDCNQQNLNRLMIHQSVAVPMQHNVLDVPATGMKSLELRDPVVELKPSAKYKSGKYILLMANCNDRGRIVAVDGTYSFKSAHGYLPGDLFGEYHYFFFVFTAYVILVGWYGWLYREHAESRIPIQTWILGTICLGLVESLLRCLDYMIWNTHGTRFPLILYSGIVTGVLKHTIARCLLVMVSLGWGVVCNTLGRNFARLMVLASTYAATAVAADVVAIVALQKVTTLGITKGDMELLGVEAILGLVVIGINILFLVWIFSAMARTMSFLKNTQQDIKLERYRHLRLLLVFFAVYACTWFILMRSELLYQFLPNSEAWIAGALMEVDYLALITGVAILWRPNPNARDYAYEMQLASDDGNELELTEEVPTALVMDDDGDEPDFAVLPVQQGVQT